MRITAETYLHIADTTGENITWHLWREEGGPAMLQIGSDSPSYALPDVHWDKIDALVRAIIAPEGG